VSFRHLQGDLDQFFGELLAGVGRPASGALVPADVYLTGDPPTLTVQLDLAGVEPESLDIQLQADVLSIRGARRRPPGKPRQYQLAEIDWGPFERRLRLLVPVDAEAATAGYERGLLTISLPLAQRAPAARVAILVRGRRG
jgi:HSP20 family protein